MKFHLHGIGRKHVTGPLVYVVVPSRTDRILHGFLKSAPGRTERSNRGSASIGDVTLHPVENGLLAVSRSWSTLRSLGPALRRRWCRRWLWAQHSQLFFLGRSGSGCRGNGRSRSWRLKLALLGTGPFRKLVSLRIQGIVFIAECQIRNLFPVL